MLESGTSMRIVDFIDNCNYRTIRSQRIAEQKYLCRIRSSFTATKQGMTSFYLLLLFPIRIS
ncbi:uncharacterized protein isoform X2 [Bombus fervidus]|uniref:uncharacterized protein isoform X2 n=1 Tax=Bombus fervidus TaxID=203811 RepID=UPI003D18C14E